MGKTCKEGLFFFSCKKQHSYEVTLKGNRNDQVIYQKRKDMHAVWLKTSKPSDQKGQLLFCCPLSYQKKGILLKPPILILGYLMLSNKHGKSAIK